MTINIENVFTYLYIEMCRFTIDNGIKRRVSSLSSKLIQAWDNKTAHGLHLF